MKKTLSLLLAFMLLYAAAIAQDRNDVFDPQVPVTFLGLDFSNAKFIGDREKLGSESDIRHLLDSWNEVILNEPDKYDVAAAIGRAKGGYIIEGRGRAQCRAGSVVIILSRSERLLSYEARKRKVCSGFLQLQGNERHRPDVRSREFQQAQC